MNKRTLIIILSAILLLLLIIFSAIIIHKNYMNAFIKPGPDKIATQRIAVVYHPYNEGISQLANIISSKLNADKFILEPIKPYPSSEDLRKDRIIDECNHPEKVMLKTSGFDLKNYNIVFIGVPVIYNKTSPLVKRFVLNQEKFLNKSIITIPFVYYSGNDSSADAYKFLYDHTNSSTRKNGFTSSKLSEYGNSMEIDIWLRDMYFTRNEFEKTTKEKANKK